MAFPTLYLGELASLADRPRKMDALRLAVLAGAPVHDELVLRIRREMNVEGRGELLAHGDGFNRVVGPAPRIRPR